MSFQKIGDILNDEGIPSFSGRGLFSKGTISNLLKNPPSYITNPSS